MFIEHIACARLSTNHFTHICHLIFPIKYPHFRDEETEALETLENTSRDIQLLNRRPKISTSSSDPRVLFCALLHCRDHNEVRKAPSDSCEVR